MAKKVSRARRRTKNFVVLKVQGTLALGALANATAIDGNFLDVDDDLRLISMDVLWAIHDVTPGEGPIEVGINSDALTPAQIVEALDASPTNRGDRIALERSGRPVRSSGIFAGQLANESLNDGRLLRTKLMFPLSQAQILNLYAVNRSGTTLTTGGTLKFTGKVYAAWT